MTPEIWVGVFVIVTFVLPAGFVWLAEITRGKL